jgi:MoaA/NifB/PqqE/SkfB family radical SAM enzyme
MSISVNSLILEITRRCNIKCRHCLRGDSQRKDITTEIIDKALDGVSNIGSVTFTGGEPTLAVSKIRYFLQAIKDRSIPLGSFYIVTNGKIAPRSLSQVLLDMYAYCDDYDREEMCSLVLSGDQYHREQLDDNPLSNGVSSAMSLYSGLSFFRPEDRKNFLQDRSVIAEGRAADWGGFDRYRNNACRVESRSEDGELYVEGELYINALGDVIPNCNLSYESQEKVKLGNVLQRSLQDILKPLDVNPKDLIETLSKKVA